MAPHADGATQQSNTTEFSNPPCSMLHVEGPIIVDASGSKVILKGAGLGGHLNFENFITGYPGHEHEHRAAMAEVLGKEKAQYFFDRLIHYFFTDADAAYFQSLVSTILSIVAAGVEADMLYTGPQLHPYSLQLPSLHRRRQPKCVQRLRLQVVGQHRRHLRPPQHLRYS
jgi:hypothetical protein